MVITRLIRVFFLTALASPDENKKHTQSLWEYLAMDVPLLQVTRRPAHKVTEQNILATTDFITAMIW
jgi:hypothetical protein